MAETVGGQCTALNLSDERRCLELATSINGLFCAFHSKQAQGLYRGYKRRNAHLDGLSGLPPQYLADSKVPLANELFADIESEEICQEIYDHLFRKYQLLERVIRARKLHHIHFFSMNCDYGHAKFLDQLQNERAIVNRALERIERRTAEILYKKRRWFKWVRQCQDEEEEHRDKEQKKVKQEAALFKRHWKEIQQRMKESRAKEEQKMQDAFLEKAYQERLAQREDEDEDSLDWDPIEDVLEDQRGRFIDLIKHLLWMTKPDSVAEEVLQRDSARDVAEIIDTSSALADLSVAESPDATKDQQVSNIEEDTNLDLSKKFKASKKKKKKKRTKASTDDQDTQLAASPTPSVTNAFTSNNNESLIPSNSTKSSKMKKKSKEKPENQEFDKNLIETREEMYKRLKHGSEYNLDGVDGVMVAGTIDNPEIKTKTVTYPDDEIEQLLLEISEIKHLLFCRLLLGHAALLPAALRAESVDTFLDDPDVTESALRDLCLKAERPGLQEIRDACADLFRSEEEVVDVDDAGTEDDADDEWIDTDGSSDEMMFRPKKPRGGLPDTWLSKREKARDKMSAMPSREDIMGGGEGTVVDFGKIKDGKFHKKIIQVKICGRTIWNYPSNKAMTRKGWLHYCIIAKDSSLHDAIALCRHWDEFFDLNILAVWHYFPGAHWLNWVGSKFRQQMLQLGFIMYFESSNPDAEELTKRQQTGRGGPYRRSYSAFEARNFICAHIKRDDPVSRRFIQYLHMQSHRLLLLVRDAETGRILVKPPEEERWLFREKSGLGRASKGEWNVIREIGPLFFEEMDKYRDWNFGFEEYYDIYIWDLLPGEPFPGLYNAAQETLIKAHRFCVGVDLYNPAAHILKTITRDKETGYVRDLKPGDKASSSIYDEIHHEKSTFFYGAIETLKEAPKVTSVQGRIFYSEADALEDEVLFPENRPFDGKLSIDDGNLRRFEGGEFSMTNFVEGWWPDSDDDDLEAGDVDEKEYGPEDDGWEDHDSESDKFSETNSKAKNGLKVLRGKEKQKTADGAIEPFATFPTALKELKGSLMPASKKKAKREPDMEQEFMDYVDREKARVFKEVWHKADPEPHAQAHYIEVKEMAKNSRKFNHRNLKNSASILTFALIQWLEVDVSTDDLRDLHKAVAKLSPFFDLEFLNSKGGQKFKESLLFNQSERAESLPDIRSSTSNTARPKPFWKEWDEMKKNIKSLEDIPVEWDVITRPIIARLYKAGVIRNRADDYYSGYAMTAQDPIRNRRDFFIDWRSTLANIYMAPKMQDPFSLPPLLTAARHFATKHPNARFAILRLWSAPHFYPLTIGYDNRDGTSFQDLTGRCYIWLFVPKDMPKSEMSMHHAARLRIEPFAKLFGKKVVVKRNAFLVMGEDENELWKLATATAYAIQRKPWRLEVDLWKSFVNVNIKFLEGLKEEWLE